MSFLKNLFKSHPKLITLLHYRQGDHGLGAEEHFHWAIGLIEDKESSTMAKVPVYQALDVYWHGAEVPAWQINHREIVLGYSAKWLGGVIIGEVELSSVDELDQLLRNHKPVPKSPGWNCRDWAMEVIGLMKQKGWIAMNISDQSELIPSLKRASQVSHDAMMKGDKPKIIGLDDEVPVE